MALLCQFRGSLCIVVVLVIICHAFNCEGKGGGGRGGGGGGRSSAVRGSSSESSSSANAKTGATSDSSSSSTAATNKPGTGAAREAGEGAAGSTPAGGGLVTGMPVAGNVATGRPISGSIATGIPARQIPAGYPVVQRPPGFAGTVPTHTYPYVYNRPTGPVAYNSGRPFPGAYRPPGMYGPPLPNRPFSTPYPGGYSLLFIPAFAAGALAGHHWAVYSQNGTFIGYDSSVEEPDYYDYEDVLPEGCRPISALPPAGEPSAAPPSDLGFLLLDGTALAAEEAPGPAGSQKGEQAAGAPAPGPSSVSFHMAHVAFECLPVPAAAIISSDADFPAEFPP
eukprot:jgi/Botrbrau1/11738/Bobra.0195s0065.1